MPRMFWRSTASLVTLSLMALVLFSFSLSSTTPLAAQDPTATPTDPIWLGFSLSRDAIQAKEKVRLPIVKNWTFAQDDWSAPNAAHPAKITGIDSCDSKVLIVNASKQLFGFTYTITSLQNKVYTTRVSFDLKAVVVCDIVEAPVVPTQVVNGTPVAGLPAPIAGSAASGTFQLGGHVDGMTQSAIDAMKRSGMTWVKKQIGPNVAVANVANEIKTIKGNGFKVFFGIVGDKNALSDAYIESFGAYAASVAAAGADAIEIWNEPNIDREWPAGQINGANYTKLLASVSVKIRAANPATMIISGAPAPTGFFGAAGCAAGGCNDDTFMKQMADAGAGQYIDCVGIHYNEGIVSPSSATNGGVRGDYPTNFFDPMINRAKQFFPGKPICFTEIGYLSPEGMGAPIPGAFAWANNVTLAQHAAWLAEAATKAAARGDVRLMIVWNVNFSRWDSDPMGGYAIIRPGGGCPACDTLGTVMRK